MIIKARIHTFLACRAVAYTLAETRRPAHSDSAKIQQKPSEIGATQP